MCQHNSDQLHGDSCCLDGWKSPASQPSVQVLSHISQCFNRLANYTIVARVGYINQVIPQASHLITESRSLPQHAFMFHMFGPHRPMHEGVGPTCQFSIRVPPRVNRCHQGLLGALHNISGHNNMSRSTELATHWAYHLCGRKPCQT